MLLLCTGLSGLLAAARRRQRCLSHDPGDLYLVALFAVCQFRTTVSVAVPRSLLCSIRNR